MEKVIRNLRTQGKHVLEEKKQREEEEKKKGVMGFFKKSNVTNLQAASSTSQLGGSPKSLKAEKDASDQSPPNDDEDFEEPAESRRALEEQKKISQRYSHLANTLKKKADKPKEEVSKERDGIHTIDDLKDIKYLLQDSKYGVGVPFNTNILRIALNFLEEKIARYNIIELNFVVLWLPTIL